MSGPGARTVHAQGELAQVSGWPLDSVPGGRFAALMPPTAELELVRGVLSRLRLTPAQRMLALVVVPEEFRRLGEGVGRG